jgi:SAM-dependent methyltransferase
MNLAALFAPHDPGLARAARELHAQRPDLRAAFPDPASVDFWRWVRVHGVIEDARIAAFHPAVPPVELRATACGGTEAQSHLHTGAEDFRTVAELFETFAERDIDSVRDVLDFGCGCGRLLRWFHTALPGCRLVGADVRAASIAWCRVNLLGTFLANGVLPPLDLPDDAVDLTVALSVFSHLSREQSIAWMAELARVTRPDGLILATTHGAFALAVVGRSREHQVSLRIAAGEVPALMRTLARDGFVHRVLPPAGLARADGVADDYGQTFLGETFARTHWRRDVEVLGCVPAALNLFQDVYLLRPR